MWMFYSMCSGRVNLRSSENEGSPLVVSAFQFVFKRRFLGRVQKEPLFRDFRFRSVYAGSVHLGELADLPSIGASFEPEFVLAEEQGVVHGIAALVVVPRVQGGCGIGGVPVYLNQEREPQMLRTREAMEEFLQAFQALLIIGIAVFVVSTLLEGIVENLPVQGPVAGIDAVGVDRDDIFDLRPIEQVLDFLLQAGIPDFLTSRPPLIGGHARRLRMLGRRGEFSEEKRAREKQRGA